MASTPPLVTVILPAYNAAPFLAEAIESITTQTYENLQIVVVDDGSTDSTPQICREAANADRRIEIVTRRNGGLSAARNSGLDRCRGRYVMFCDADDRLYPAAVSTLIKGVESAPIAVGQYVEAVEMPAVSACETNPEFITIQAGEALEATLYQQPWAHNSVCAKLFESKLFKKIRFREGVWYEDLEITMRLYEAVDMVAFSHTAVYFYRNNMSSFINTWSERRLDVLKVTDEIVGWAAARHPSLIEAALSRRFSAYYNIFLTANRAGDDLTASRCWKEIKNLRGHILGNRRVRIKNRLGALVAFGGAGFTTAISKITRK